MKIGLVRWLLLLWMMIKEALQHEPRVHYLTFTEGEVYFHDFSPSLYLNPEGTFSLSHSDRDTNKNRNEYRSLEFRNKPFNVNISKPNININEFEKYSCIPKPFGNVTELAIVYERSVSHVTSGQGKYFIQFKRIEYGNSSVDPVYYYPNQTMKDITEIDMKDYNVQSSSCKQEIVINEFRRVLFICQSITHNQYFVLSICSDSTCNEQTESLKIKDYVKDAQFDSINVKEMPGIDERTFSLIIWFNGLPYLEYLLIDEVGKMESQVFKLDFDIIKIRYFAGQFVSFESKNKMDASKSMYYFMFFDFGVKRLEFNKAKPREMLNFGNFVNSYVNSINGEIIVELLDKEMLLDMSLRRQSGEFVIEYSKRIFQPNETNFDSTSVLIFELGGDYQIVIERNKSLNSPSRGDMFKRFKVVNRFESVESGAGNPFRENVTMWRKVSGFGKLTGCSIERVNSSENTQHQFKISMREIHLVEPYARLDIPDAITIGSLNKTNPSQNSTSEKEKNQRYRQDWINSFNFSFNITKYKNDSHNSDPKPVNSSEIYEKINYKVIKKTGFKIGYKQSIIEGSTIEIESSGTTSDELYPLKNLIRGNLMALTKACYSRDQSNCSIMKNKINPLLSYRSIMSTTKTEDLVVKELKTANLILALASNHEYRAAFDILGYNQKIQNLSIYESKERSLIRKKSEVQKINFNYSEVFNDTIFIIHSEMGLYMYDSTTGSIKELIFDSGKCERILLMRHTGLDLLLWCFFNTSASAFYARDVVEGKAGIRKIPVIIEKELQFSGKTLKFNDYFPEFIFMMSPDNLIEILKIETDSAVRINRIGTIDLGENLVNSRMCDFDMIDRHLMIYHLQRIGYGDRILLNFYFIENPVKFVRTKLIPVDYKFSPQTQDLNIYRYEDKKKYGMARTKYSNNPMLIISVLYLNKYANMLFIDIKAPIAESIPFSLLPLSSNVTEMMVGKSLSTNENHIRYSIVVFYEFDEHYRKAEEESTRRRASVMKIDETDPALRLSDTLDKNFFFMNPSKTTLPYQHFVFEKDMISDNGDEIAITVDRKQLAGRSHRLELASQVQFFETDSLRLNMKETQQNNTIEIPGTINSQLYWLLNVTNITQGDVKEWSLRMESLLEQASNGINFNPLIRNRTLLSQQQALASMEYRTLTKICTQTRRDYLELKILNSDLLSVPVDFNLCLDMKELRFSAKVYNSSVPYVLNFTKPNDLLTANPENLHLYTNEGILELINYRKLNGRIVFSDFYKINLDLSQSISKDSFNLTIITRRFFAETTKDYLIRKRQNGIVNPGTSLPTTYYEFYEWSILKGPGRFYILGLVREHWNIIEINESTVNMTKENNKIELKLILNETLTDNKTKIEIYDEFSFKVIDRNDKDYLWLILENPVFETYIIRYSINKLTSPSDQLSSTGNYSLPSIWKLSNPYYGFESTYEIKAVKSDWLLVHFKIMNDVSYMMVYIVPPEIFPTQPQSSLETLFVKEAALFRNVIDLQLEKPLEFIGSKKITQRKK